MSWQARIILFIFLLELSNIRELSFCKKILKISEICLFFTAFIYYKIVNNNVTIKHRRIDMAKKPLAIDNQLLAKLKCSTAKIGC